MSDIVKRLKTTGTTIYIAADEVVADQIKATIDAAVDEIERLRRELDKVRGVVMVYPEEESDKLGCAYKVRNDPNPTHLLVPVEMVGSDYLMDGEVVLFLKCEARECPTCVGSGVYSGMPDFIGDEHPTVCTCSPCESCNGRGWVLQGGDDE